MSHLYKLTLVFLFLFVGEITAQQIGLQGVLRDQAGRSVASGTYSLTFKLYSAATGGNAIWSETHAAVNVQQGVYSVYLGSVTSLDAVNFDAQYFIGISIQGGAELSPRAPLTTVPYARGIVGKTNKFPSSGDVSIGGNLALTGNTNVSGNLNLGQGGVLNFFDGTFLSSGAVSGIATSGSSSIRINTDDSGTDALNVQFGSASKTAFSFLPSMLLTRNASISTGGMNLNSADSTYVHEQITRNGQNRFVWTTSVAQSGDATTGTGGHSLILERMKNDGGGLGDAVVFHRDGRTMFNGSRNTAFNASVKIESRNNDAGGLENAPLELGLGNNANLVVYRRPNTKTAVIENEDGDIAFATGASSTGTIRKVVIGSGTSTTDVPLQVFGKQNVTLSGGFAFLARNTSNFSGGPTPQPVSIQAEGNIIGLTLQAYSDKRIKNVRGRSDAESDLAILNQIEVTDYTHIDYVTKGDGPIKKVIAQQVETIYPQAVKQQSDFLPDIYMPALTSVYNAEKGGQTFKVGKKHGLKPGDEVQFATSTGRAVKKVSSVQNETTFTVASEEELVHVFVYGKKVHDFRTVDYEAISMLNVSATQALYKRIQELEAKNAALSAEVSKMKDLEAKHALLSAEMSELKDLVRGLSQQAVSKTAGQPSHR